MSDKFSILSTHAPLVEVAGDGPTTDVAGGLAISSGALTTGRVDLLNGPVRRWRVDAPPSVQTRVSVTDSPYGVFVRLRRCVPLARRAPWWRFLSVTRWPRLRARLQERAPNLLAVWYLLTDEDPPAAPSATNGARAHPPFTVDGQLCAWRDVGDDITSEVTAFGGDLVIVTFISP
jgi:hypothetical protein